MKDRSDPSALVGYDGPDCGLRRYVRQALYAWARSEEWVEKARYEEIDYNIRDLTEDTEPGYSDSYGWGTVEVKVGGGTRKKREGQQGMKDK